MNISFAERQYPVLAWIWLLVISALTVIKYSPAALNADILINSVMSLQKLTLYYWGQNRLLNVLPLATAGVKDPTINLAATLLLASISFYGFLYLTSRTAAILLGARDLDAISFNTFLILSSAFIFVFKPFALADITIGHIEYSLAALLLVFAVLKLFSKRDTAGDWRPLALSVFAIALAIGLNPSTILPAFFIAAAVVFHKKRIGFEPLLLAGSSGIAFLVWRLVEKQYGDLPYGEFKPEILPSGLEKVADKMMNAINLPLLLALLAIFSVVKISILTYGRIKEPYIPSIVSYSAHAVFLFFAGWLVLFSSSRWVEMNQFAPRYFTYAFFALFFLCAMHIVYFFSKLSTRGSLALVAATALAAIFFLASPVLRFNQYNVFQRVDALTEPGGNLYSGDYWVVWPSVLRDLMRGYEAYGLSNRGEANREAAREYVLDQIAGRGHASVFCLNDKVDNCISQINAIVGPLSVVSTHHIKDSVYRIRFVEHAPLLDFSGRDLRGLPSQVGQVENSRIKTNSRSGFLVFGPYAPLKSGRYLLSVTGSVNRLDGAFVDVVSGKGQVVHAKFGFLERGDGYLVRNAEISLPVDVSDLEVRVWVGEIDDIELLGYSLKPFENGM